MKHDTCKCMQYSDGIEQSIYAQPPFMTRIGVFVMCFFFYFHSPLQAPTTNQIHRSSRKYSYFGCILQMVTITDEYSIPILYNVSEKPSILRAKKTLNRFCPQHKNTDTYVRTVQSSSQDAVLQNARTETQTHRGPNAFTWIMRLCEYIPQSHGITIRNIYIIFNIHILHIVSFTHSLHAYVVLYIRVVYDRLSPCYSFHLYVGSFGALRSCAMPDAKMYKWY